LNAWASATPACCRRISWVRSLPSGCAVWRRFRSCRALGRRIGA